MNEIKALFSEGIETITISKNDYDRLFGQLTYENIILQSKIDRTIELLEGFKGNSKDVENEWAVEICELSIRKLKEDKR